MINLSFPFSEEKIRALKVGDEVLISGVVFTGRDAVHKYLHEGGALPPGVSLRDGILYHCGPVMMKQDDGTYKCTAAGPTTSIREEPYQWQVIRDFGLRGRRILGCFFQVRNFLFIFRISDSGMYCHSIVQ